MHIVIDKTLTMYSLQDTCNAVHDKLIVAASLQTQGAQEQHQQQTLWFSTLYLLTPRQCDDIEDGVPTLPNRPQLCTYKIYNQRNKTIKRVLRCSAVSKAICHLLVAPSRSQCRDRQISWFQVSQSLDAASCELCPLIEIAVEFSRFQ